MYEQRRVGAYKKESYKQRPISPDEIFQGTLKLILKENYTGKGKWGKDPPNPIKFYVGFKEKVHAKS